MAFTNIGIYKIQPIASFTASKLSFTHKKLILLYLYTHLPKIVTPFHRCIKTYNTTNQQFIMAEPGIKKEREKKKKQRKGREKTGAKRQSEEWQRQTV